MHALGEEECILRYYQQKKKKTTQAVKTPYINKESIRKKRSRIGPKDRYGSACQQQRKSNKPVGIRGVTSSTPLLV